VSYAYLLSAKGSDFVGVLVAIMRWGDRWLDGGPRSCAI
jgi:DNA-binding HxlR family transcriptional regulator